MQSDADSAASARAGQGSKQLLAASLNSSGDRLQPGVLVPRDSKLYGLCRKLWPPLLPQQGIKNDVTSGKFGEAAVVDTILCLYNFNFPQATSLHNWPVKWGQKADSARQMRKLRHGEASGPICHSRCL